MAACCPNHLKPRQLVSALVLMTVAMVASTLPAVGAARFDVIEAPRFE
jgi:hypothetical protein